MYILSYKRKKLTVFMVIFCFIFILMFSESAFSINNKSGNNMKTNRLIHEKSPYLLQHADNPVDWYPWGEEAFKKALEEDKPIFLSIGYSTCHWCHVMEH
jgi:thioredoxin-related protein